MRTHKLLSVALLGLLLWAACARAEDPEDKEAEVESVEKEAEEEEKEEPKKEKTTEIEEEKDVMVLHINNFGRALNETKFLLVEFYAPWCGHCKQLEPIYAEAAGILKKEGEGLRLAKVDAIEERELADEFDVGGFPTLKLFVNGDRKQPVDFTGKRSLEGITQWMKRRSGPGAPTLDSVDSAAQFIDAHNLTVVGFFDSLESEAAKALKEISLDMTDTEFALTESPEVLKKFEVKASSVVLFKKFDEGRADFPLPDDGKLDKNNVTSFIKANSLELIIPFSPESSEKIFTSSIRLHSLIFVNSTVQSQNLLLAESRLVAKEFKGKMLFISIDVTASLSHVLSYFGVSEKDAPTARVIDMDSGKKFVVAPGELTTNSLRQLCQAVVDGTAKPYYKSEEIPEDWDKNPVKVLVGKNFEAVALDPAKNVFVEFYAPWCAHCKELSPIWDQLGEKYKDHADIIIAKMDSTANELESVKVDGFPTLKYFPADGKEVITYGGKRDLETLSQFLDSGGVLPKEEGSDDNDDDDDDDDDAAVEGEKAEDEEKSTVSAEEATNKTKDEL